MLGTFIRSVCGGAAALLLVQGSAAADLLPMANIIQTVIANSSGTSETFGENPVVNPVDDWYLVDFTGSGQTNVLMEFKSPPATLDPNDFSLELFGGYAPSAGVTVSGTDYEYNPTALDSGSMLLLTLTTGQYLLHVVHPDSLQSYSGRISAVPLPPALVIFGTGLLGLGLLSRYRRRRQGQLGLKV